MKKAKHFVLGFLVAEREGFEPSLQLPVNFLSREALSATQPPLRRSYLNKFAFNGRMAKLVKGSILQNKKTKIVRLIPNLSVIQKIQAIWMVTQAIPFKRKYSTHIK